MIRVYLDWNIVTSLESIHKNLYNKLRANKNVILIPFSDGHINELRKVKTVCNTEKYAEDLATLMEISGEYHIKMKDGFVHPFLVNPKDYFDNPNIDFFDFSYVEELFSDDSISVGPSDNPLKKIKHITDTIPFDGDQNDHIRKSLQAVFPGYSGGTTFWDLLKEGVSFMTKLHSDRDYYLGYKKNIRDHGLVLDSNSGNWEPEEVTKRISGLIKSKGTEKGFHELIYNAVENQNGKPTPFEHYIAAYITLDMFGYKSDRLKKKSNTPENIRDDAVHSFYAAHTDFFVTDDSNLRKKTRVLYHDFNISTLVIDPIEFEKKIDSYIHDITDDPEVILNQAFSLVDLENPQEYYGESSKYQAETFVIKLNYFFLNYFNYGIFQYYEKDKKTILSFRRVDQNLSRFSFYNENEVIVAKLFEIFGKPDSFEDHLKKLVYGNDEYSFVWKINGGNIVCMKETDVGKIMFGIILTQDS